MIPKIVHYAWFGREIPIEVEERVQRWKQILPDWEFKLWNEENWDFSQYSFSKQMYETKNWAYLTDVLRLDVLNKYGGVYLDTDMELKKSLSPFLAKRLVMGYLYKNSLATGIILAEPNHEFINNMLQVYENRAFTKMQPVLLEYTNNPIMTVLFSTLYPEFSNTGVRQEIQDGILILPLDYFSYFSRNREANFAEHLFMNSWGITNKQSVRSSLKSVLRNHFPTLWTSLSSENGRKVTEKDIQNIFKEIENEA
ncbi:glycosyltransferase family 32 protein [Leuconostoc citreum]|uniref:glycosyltransferase family 32 protein n=1 Tax=Leuconostoc citreum TaxID=33964 RepID=UPI00186B925C|nr:glycosyltransferase [Leuconostoc citreum]MBE4726288.1 glycosyl transferase [Leuconostoc citreum]